ncbi:P-loop nucleoside triphosphate hydrolase [Rhizoctonia solani AG-3 Rhs1AP]|uniref:p-loop nucleoside triphosphate hydrolase n=2 Tax=Rhizoctonia solani AG-3 TaxID=1086053 RepID=A0A074SDR9_9AGAM|nr:P-loop nucleoside triphosphate hydrolase [Rhizoctonia solani AG-3 Rhs1AP]KEP55800.1 P-loop nucleoside triphosphate hydrolase [Rhizoctonia solani 123E]
MSNLETDKSAGAIDIRRLTYKHNNYSDAISPALVDLSLSLPKGSRTLLIGANGAGKSTLLQILAGKRLIQSSEVRIFGRDVFRNSPPGITYLGTEWAMNPVVRSDIVVSHFLDSIGGYRHKARRDRLLNILDVDLDWHMHTISDGERRRVQMVMGLMGEWDVLLLDEENDLLAFLKEESETRGATILYATHIFDGLNTFPTHVAHMRFGQFVSEPAPWLQQQTEPNLPSPASGSTLHALALRWLKEDREFRQREEAAGRLSKTRGAKPDTGVPTDSEVFYKK